MGSGYDIAVDIAMRSALLFFFIGSLFCLLYGAGLLARSRWVFRLNDWGKGWVSTRQVMRKMEESHDVDASAFEGHRWVGTIIALGSVYVLVVLLVQYDMRSLVAALLGAAPHWASDLALRAVWMLLVVGALAGLILGVCLLARPETLRALQLRLNRNYSARRATKFLEVMNLGPDQWISSYPRASGAVITLGSLYIAYSLGVVVISRV